METKSERDARIFASQNPAGRVVMVATHDPRSSTFFTSTVVEKKAYDNFGVPVVKLEGWSWPIPIRYVKAMPWMVTSYR